MKTWSPRRHKSWPHRQKYRGWSLQAPQVFHSRTFQTQHTFSSSETRAEATVRPRVLKGAGSGRSHLSARVLFHHRYHMLSRPGDQGRSDPAVQDRDLGIWLTGTKANFLNEVCRGLVQLHSIGKWARRLGGSQEILSVQCLVAFLRYLGVLKKHYLSFFLLLTLKLWNRMSGALQTLWPLPSYRTAVASSVELRHCSCVVLSCHWHSD